MPNYISENIIETKNNIYRRKNKNDLKYIIIFIKIKKKAKI